MVMPKVSWKALSLQETTDCDYFYTPIDFQGLIYTVLFTVSENMRTQDTWFLLLISAI